MLRKYVVVNQRFGTLAFGGRRFFTVAGAERHARKTFSDEILYTLRLAVCKIVEPDKFREMAEDYGYKV